MTLCVVAHSRVCTLDSRDVLLGSLVALDSQILSDHLVVDLLELRVVKVFEVEGVETVNWPRMTP